MDNMDTPTTSTGLLNPSATRQGHGNALYTSSTPKNVFVFISIPFLVGYSGDMRGHDTR